MDNKEATEILKAWSTDEYPLALLMEAVDLAIKVLETRQCEDAISRQQCIDAVNKILAQYVPKIYLCTLSLELEKTITDLPSVSTDKTGRWIESNGVGMFVCSVCNKSFYPMPTYTGKPLRKDCPNCGAKMQKETETCKDCTNKCIMYDPNMKGCKDKMVEPQESEVTDADSD